MLLFKCCLIASTQSLSSLGKITKMLQKLPFSSEGWRRITIPYAVFSSSAGVCVPHLETLLSQYLSFGVFGAFVSPNTSKCQRFSHAQDTWIREIHGSEHILVKCLFQWILPTLSAPCSFLYGAETVALICHSPACLPTAAHVASTPSHGHPRPGGPAMSTLALAGVLPPAPASLNRASSLSPRWLLISLA